jgi:pimeloyl-ACP methyl ester carboxylesterase
MLLLALALLSAQPVERAHRRVVTDDGLSLALVRYGSPRTPKGTVLLVPDLGLTAAVFDFDGEGLAPALARAGFSVVVAELRGQGRSQRPLLDRLEDRLRRDLPAVLQELAREDPSPVSLVVQGYGGALVLGALEGPLRGRVRRVVAVSTPVEFELPSPLMEKVLEGGGDLPALASDPAGARSFEVLLHLDGRIPAPALRRLRTEAVEPLGREVAAQLLAWLRTGELPLWDGSLLSQRLAAYDRPTLLLLPLLEGWAPPELAAPLRERSAAKITVRTFSRFDGSAEDYSHLSVWQGQGAARDVFAPVIAYLEQH